MSIRIDLKQKVINLVQLNNQLVGIINTLQKFLKLATDSIFKVLTNTTEIVKDNNGESAK